MGHRKHSRGFSMLEMLISLTIGLVLIGAAVKIFSQGLNTTFVVTQRAEMQQDARAASNLLIKDISMAGAGLPSGGVALVSGGGVSIPKFGCDYNGICYTGPNNNTAKTYPQQTVSGNTVNYLYGIIPGWKGGIQINASAGPTDLITVVYTDSTFRLFDYQVKFNDINGNSVTFTLPTPAPNPLDQAVNNPGVGLQQGDLVLFTNNTGGAAIAEVTAPLGAGGGPSYTVAFANASPLGFNQNAGTSGNLKNAIIQNNNANVGVLLPASSAAATRLWVITYYLDNTNCTPYCLMRQVNGRTPTPVSENVASLQFTYDTYDASGNLLNATGDGGMSATPSISPSLIRRVNIANLSFRSEMQGASAANGNKGYQSLDIQTSVSARNLSFINRYQ